ncbi:protein fuzzy homolog [Pecten maximus]|uniref:protein fuzzy homolog n=1 Tax=Pecten maximus TaxID=6579 RepID=UPI001458DB07|nr:protein fuzzy homolog [Pecten maximus]
MAVYVTCLTASGGLPVFTRSSGDLKPLPFPLIGSLNGVHMFGANHNVDLLSSTTDDSKVIWKVFQDSITLIIISQDDIADDCHMTNILKFIHQSLVLLLGKEEVQNIDKNVEKFKREVKVCNNLIDHFIQAPTSTTFSQLTNTVEIIAAPENTVLQNFLDAFTDAAETVYGCLLVEGKVSVATKKWWNLTANELVLLGVLVSSMSDCTSRDLPVYLPDSHPTVPHRLMTFHLTKCVQVCVICGPTPTLADLEPEVVRFWKTAYDPLISVCRLHPRNFPITITLDPNMLGFLVVNRDTNRCLCSTSPSLEDRSTLGDGLNTAQRKEVLQSFYKKIVGSFFSSNIEGSELGPGEYSHSPQETYITTDIHKCYAAQSGSYQIFILYTDSIPTYAMRSITQKTLNLLTKDRHVCI